MGPLLFLLNINDLPDCIDGLSLFDDDTALIQFDADIANLCTKLQNGINVVHKWMLSWRLKPNILKTEIVFLPQLDHPPTFTLPGLDLAININVTNLCYDYDLRMSLYLVLVLWSPVSDVIYGLGVRVSMV